MNQLDEQWRKRCTAFASISSVVFILRKIVGAQCSYSSLCLRGNVRSKKWKKISDDTDAIDVKRSGCKQKKKTVEHRERPCWIRSFHVSRFHSNYRWNIHTAHPRRALFFRIHASHETNAKIGIIYIRGTSIHCSVNASLWCQWAKPLANDSAPSVILVDGTQVRVHCALCALASQGNHNNFLYKYKYTRANIHFRYNSIKWRQTSRIHSHMNLGSFEAFFLSNTWTFEILEGWSSATSTVSQ